MCSSILRDEMLEPTPFNFIDPGPDGSIPRWVQYGPLDRDGRQVCPKINVRGSIWHERKLNWCSFIYMECQELVRRFSPFSTLVGLGDYDNRDRILKTRSSFDVYLNFETHCAAFEMNAPKNEVAWDNCKKELITRFFQAMKTYTLTIYHRRCRHQPRITNSQSELGCWLFFGKPIRACGSVPS